MFLRKNLYCLRKLSTQGQNVIRSGEGVLSFQNLCLILLQKDHAIKYVRIKFKSNQIFFFNRENVQVWSNETCQGGK